MTHTHGKTSHPHNHENHPDQHHHHGDQEFITRDKEGIIIVQPDEYQEYLDAAKKRGFFNGNFTEINSKANRTFKAIAAYEVLSHETVPPLKAFYDQLGEREGAEVLMEITATISRGVLNMMSGLEHYVNEVIAVERMLIAAHDKGIILKDADTKGLLEQHNFNRQKILNEVIPSLGNYDPTLGSLTDLLEYDPKKEGTYATHATFLSCVSHRCGYAHLATDTLEEGTRQIAIQSDSNKLRSPALDELNTTLVFLGTLYADFFMDQHQEQHILVYPISSDGIHNTVQPAKIGNADFIRTMTKKQGIKHDLLTQAVKSIPVREIYNLISCGPGRYTEIRGTP